MATPLLLGVEFGGTKLQLGIGPGDGTLVALERRTVRPGSGALGIRGQFVEAVDALLRRGPDRMRVEAVGIGFGGPVDPDHGLITVSNQIEGWAGFPIVAWMREVLGVGQIVLSNDADTAALGEARFGAGVGRNPVLYVTIGSGIGGGLIIDDAIYRGSGRGAVEIGHLDLEDTDRSGGGAPGLTTLEARCSGWSIARRARDLLQSALPGPLLRLCEGDLSRITAELVAKAAAEGDEVASTVLHLAHRAMGRALSHAINLLAPQRIILGGGVSMIGEEGWFAPIRSETERSVFRPFRGTYDIVPPALGETVVVHGALALALDAYNLGVARP